MTYPAVETAPLMTGGFQNTSCTGTLTRKAGRPGPVQAVGGLPAV